MNIAKIRRIGRKGKSLVVECEDNEPGIRNVPAAVRADQGAQALSETLDQQPTIVETVTVVEMSVLGGVTDGTATRCI